jgi:hypothetical protein
MLHSSRRHARPRARACGATRFAHAARAASLHLLQEKGARGGGGGGASGGAGGAGGAAGGVPGGSGGHHAPDKKQYEKKLEDLVFEAVRTLKHTATLDNIANQIEDKYDVPAGFRKQLAAHLKSLADAGKLVKSKTAFVLPGRGAVRVQMRAWALHRTCSCMHACVHVLTLPRVLLRVRAAAQGRLRRQDGGLQK